MPGRFEYIYVTYDEARKHIKDGDVLLYRRRGLISRCISQLGRSAYSHAGMAGWTNGDHKSPYSRLMAHEMLYTGGQLNHLSAHAEKYPGCVDVYRVQDAHARIWWQKGIGCAGVLAQEHVGFDRKHAVALMRDFCRQGEYGFWHLMWVAWLHTPLVRFFARQPTDDDIERRQTAPFCSEAVAYALRKAFTDVVKNTPDHYTEPADLARSPTLHYLFTLLPPEGDWLPQHGDVIHNGCGQVHWSTSQELQPPTHAGPPLTGHEPKP